MRRFRLADLPTVFYGLFLLAICFMVYTFLGLDYKWISYKIKGQFYYSANESSTTVLRKSAAAGIINRTSVASHPSDSFNKSLLSLTDSNNDFMSVSISKVISGEPIQIPQDEPKLTDYIVSNKLLEPPSTEEYSLEHPDKDPSRGQGQFIRKILNNMENGFFVECGALDGETRSNTLFLEQHLGWKGLLIEGDPNNYAKMKRKHRKAWISNTCLAVKPHPHKANFFQSFNLGKIVDDSDQEVTKSKVTEVQCMPLFSLLSAINITTVDYFSLDVEGSELQVLKTIPFDKVFIKTLSVEYVHTKEGKDALLSYMEKNNYVKVGTVRYPGNLANDYMFAHKNVDFSN